jgi:phosphate:Na+ symporter
MDIFSVIKLLGGLALFLYGMSVMSQGLEKLAGGRLESILRTMTSNKFKALLLGLGVTAVIQSSSAVTVMLVGLVNSGIMTLEQTVGVIMGSNIGTTVTAWILSLAGIESDNVWIQLLNPDSFSPVLALIGVIMMMGAKSNKKKDVGMVLVGFAVLMYGMEFMSDSMSPLKNSPEFTRILTLFHNPLLGLAAGILITAVIQSSSASVGILQALSMSSNLTYAMVIPIIMGQNIGTCVTALISSVGVNKNAKRVAAVHISFNIIGTAIFMCIYCIAYYAIDVSWLHQVTGPAGIAIAHSMFNILTTIMLFPFTDQLVSISRKLVKPNEYESFQKDEFLDKRLLNTPSVAVSEALNKSNEMVDLSFSNLKLAIELSDNYSEALFEKLSERENMLDYYEDQLSTFCVNVSHCDISERDSGTISMVLHTITDTERIGDRVMNIAEDVKELTDKGLKFSHDAVHELNTLSNAIIEVTEHTKKAYVDNDVTEALLVEPLEEAVDDLVEQIRANHIRRLRNGTCTVELGFILNDILANMERISDHCSNIAAAEVELQQGRLFTHEYKNKIKDKRNEEFETRYREFSGKYSL